jgi:cytochrome c biogenesis protein ResB
VRRMLRALKSLRLALALIAYLAVTAIVASLLPQGREAAFYYTLLPAPLAWLALKSGFANFYASALFLIPVFLFFANLATCSADRFARELKRGKPRRHGPDILHLGLILLLIGAVLGQAAKQSRPSWEGFVRLGAGEAVELPNGRRLTIKDLKSERYADGRPKDWISRVELSQSGKILLHDYPIRVNHPLRMGALSVYQASYGAERVLELISPDGARRSLASGEYIQSDKGRLMLMSIDLESGKAIAREEGGSGARTIGLEAGSRIGEFTVLGAKELALSGLQAAYDPAYPLVLAAFALIGLGTVISLARKLGELKA